MGPFSDPRKIRINIDGHVPGEAGGLFRPLFIFAIDQPNEAFVLVVATTREITSHICVYTV